MKQNSHLNTMFSTTDKLKALSIVNVFETSKPYGDFAALAVLNDGAGLSYGISQFTHRSGALLAVVERYLESGGAVGRTVFERCVPLLRRKTVAAIAKLSGDETFKKALKTAAITGEMRSAQRAVAFERFLGPAIGACEKFGFARPLSLAVVYDSMNQGSWERIRDAVSADIPTKDEKRWITEYVVRRHKWLTRVPRLKPTAYRTRFFLEQIALGKWDLDFPLKVRGVRLDAGVTPEDSAVGPELPPHTGSPGQPEAPHPSTPPDPSENGLPHSPAQPPNASNGEKTTAGELIDRIEDRVNDGAARFDQVEGIVTTVIRRTDAAKSLWTAVVGTASQTAWALFGLLAGVPREVWFVVAVIAGVLTLAYLYRQIMLGRIREKNAALLIRDPR